MLVSAGNCHLLGATSFLLASSLPPSRPISLTLIPSSLSLPSRSSSLSLAPSQSAIRPFPYPLLYARRPWKSPATGRKLFRKHFTVESSTSSRVLLFTRTVVLGPAGNPSNTRSPFFPASLSFSYSVHPPPLFRSIFLYPHVRIWRRVLPRLLQQPREKLRAVEEGVHHP